MLFNTAEFALFFVVVYGFYLVLSHRGQNLLLLAASYFFYGFWDWRYLSLLLLSTLVDYSCGRLIGSTADQRRRRIYLWASIVFSIGLLGVFKYYDFFASSLQEVAATLGFQIAPTLLKVILPVGISFYTFQSISYVIDVYRRQLPASRSLADYALYVAFFPHLVAGPIVRAPKLLPQLTGRRVVTFEGFSEGCQYFLWGLFLKSCVADNLGEFVDPVFAQDGGWQGGMVLLALYAFAFQIFGDFAGYTGMAFGLAKMLGIELMQNFRAPYLARDMGDFWRRWHITLSYWIRDYLYLPLGGSQRGELRNAFNLIVIFLVCGLWHGAGWNFILWGLFHGVAVQIHRVIRSWWSFLPNLAQTVITFHVVCLGWLLFRANGVNQAWGMFLSLFSNFGPLDQNFVNTLANVALYISLPLLHQVWEARVGAPVLLLRLSRPLRHAFGLILVMLVFYFGSFGERSFIYFQF